MNETNTVEIVGQPEPHDCSECNHDVGAGLVFAFFAGVALVILAVGNAFN